MHQALQETLTELTGLYGPSGQEEAVREAIRRRIGRSADEVRVDAMGNLIARKGKVGRGGKRVMVAAHMDEVGLIVTHVDQNGFLRFTNLGGIHSLSLLGSRVVFADGQVGTVGLEEDRPDTSKAPRLQEYYLDVGARDHQRRVGDVAVFHYPMADAADRVIAKSLDDRLGCAVALEALRQVKGPNELSFVFTVQEEVGLRGALTSAYALAPEVALAIDVTTTGDTPESEKMAVRLGGGPAIKFRDAGMLAHEGVRNALIEAAEKRGIPYQREVLTKGSTDAMAMQVAREGVPAGVVSIPTRYVHTPSQVADWSDIEGALELLVGFLSRPIAW